MEKLFSIGYLRNYNSKEVCFHNKTPLRKTTSYEIELYTLGGNITVINGKEYLQKPGNVVVASPGDARYSIKYFKCYSIHFSCYCTEIIDYLNSLPKVFEFYNQKKLSEIFEDMLLANSAKKAGYELYLQSKILEIISLLVNNTSVISKKYAQYSKNISNACNFIESSYQHDISLDDMAKSSFLSPSFFHKVFKEVMGITPSQYLLKTRLSSAQKLLENTNKRIIDIAYLSGFSSHSYFNQVFKQTFKMTPNQYRTSQKNEIIL